MTDITQRLIQCIPRLRRYAQALTGDRNRADDLVQDSLERAWSRLHLWRGSGDLRAWLFTIMHNIFANDVRQYARTPRMTSLQDEKEPAAADGGLDQILHLQDIQRALQELPEAQREVLLLVGMEQLSYEEVATILDIPIGTVMSRLARAREHLRASLGQPRPVKRPGLLRRVK